MYRNGRKCYRKVVKEKSSSSFSTWVVNVPELFRAGSIIPFASGPLTLISTTVQGDSRSVGLIGFGNNEGDVPITGTGQIDFDDPSITTNMAFSLPRDGVITSMEAFFTLTSVNLIDTIVTIQAQLYHSPSPTTNLFDPIPETLIQLVPELTGAVPSGSLLRGGLDGLSIPVAQGDRLLMVFSMVSRGEDPQREIAGRASAGVTID